MINSIWIICYLSIINTNALPTLNLMNDKSENILKLDTKDNDYL